MTKLMFHNGLSNTLYPRTSQLSNQCIIMTTSFNSNTNFTKKVFIDGVSSHLQVIYFVQGTTKLLKQPTPKFLLSPPVHIYKFT